MVTLGMGKHPCAAQNTARFRIIGTKVQPPDPRVRNRTSAHGARFKCDVQISPSQPFDTQNGTCVPDCQHLRMRGWIIQFPRAIARLRNDRTIKHDHRAHWHLTTRGGSMRFCQRLGHMRFEHHRAVIDRGRTFPKPCISTKRQAMTEKTPPGDRIAKVMSRAGIASRRDAEKMILEGRVKVNGKVVERAALNVTPDDKIVVDGKPIKTPDAARIWLYHKPVGLVTTTKDEQGRDTIFDKLPEDMPRVMSVGRLDLNSEGLLLLTNDGGVKRKLELPSTGWLRKYRVRVKGNPTDDMLEPLRAGLRIDGEKFQPMTVSLDRQQGANAWLTIGLREGKNREIRRALAELGLTVNRLIRVSYGPFQLGQLKPGAVEELRRKVVRDQLGLDEDTKEGRAKPQKPKGKLVQRKPRPARPRKTP